MKVEIFSGKTTTEGMKELQEEINEWFKGHPVEVIKTNVVVDKSEEEENWYTVFIFYE